VTRLTPRRARAVYIEIVIVRRARRPLGALGAALLLSGLARAGDLPRFSSGTDLVVLSATAVDRRGRPVTNLRHDEFRVFEDGRPQRLEHFSEGRSVPARLLLLVDASGSMNGALKTTSARMAAVQILAGLQPGDEVALAGFDHKYWGLVPFTHDRVRILAAFGDLEPFGSTALHDALDHAARDLASWGVGRRAVVVVTDGVDTASQLRPDDVLARSQALDVPIYAVSVVSPVDDPDSDLFTGRQRPAAATAGTALLARYAELSGGASFVASDLAGLQRAAATILGELKHQYRLAYDPPPGPSGFRRVEVQSTRKGVLVKTRSGYVPRT
jgi:Ca-activated chloride channel family protein